MGESLEVLLVSNEVDSCSLTGVSILIQVKIVRMPVLIVEKFFKSEEEKSYIM